jgi:hypothetical protein
MLAGIMRAFMAKRQRRDTPTAGAAPAAGRQSGPVHVRARLTMARRIREISDIGDAQQ